MALVQKFAFRTGCRKTGRKKDADFCTAIREHDPEKWVPVFGKIMLQQ
jgi:hypothetical protein